MRPVIFLLASLIAAIPASASVCSPAGTEARSSGSRWTVDHYVYDASLAKHWVVMVDCNHPQAPARMVLIKGVAGGDYASRVAQPVTAIHSGASVELFNTSGPASIRLSGTAIDSVSLGQLIRVRLHEGGGIVRGYARSSHMVELAAAQSSAWSAQ